jgi:predicted RNA-binding protein Jag
MVDHSSNRDNIEVEAKTVAEAIKIALKRIGAKRSEVNIQVLREENKGLFSMNGSKLAKIKLIKKL